MPGTVGTDFFGTRLGIGVLDRVVPHAEELLLLIVDDAAVVQGHAFPGPVALDDWIIDVFGSWIESEGGIFCALDHVLVYEQLPVGTDVGETLYAVLCHVNVYLWLNWLEVTSYPKYPETIKALLDLQVK